jgi:hypothetical protein
MSDVRREEKPKIEILKEWPRFVIKRGISKQDIEDRKKDCPEGSQFVAEFRWADFNRRLKKTTKGHDVVWPACITCPDGYELAYKNRGDKFKTEQVMGTYEEVDENGYKTGKTRTTPRAAQYIPVCLETKEAKEKRFIAGKNLSNLDLYHRGKPTSFQQTWIEARERGDEYFSPATEKEYEQIGTVPCGITYRTIAPAETEDIYRASLATYRNLNSRYKDDDLNKQIAIHRGSAYYTSETGEVKSVDPRFITDYTTDDISKYTTDEANAHKKILNELQNLNYKWVDWVGAIYKENLTSTYRFIKWSKNIKDLEFDPPNVSIDERWAKIAKLPQCPKLNVPDPDLHIEHKRHNFLFSFKQFYVDIATAQARGAIKPDEVANPAKWETNYNFEEAHAKVYIEAKKLELLTDTTATQKPSWTLDDRLADLRGQRLGRKGKSFFFEAGLHGQITRQLAFSKAEGVAKGRPRVSIAFLVTVEPKNKFGEKFFKIKKNFIEYGPGPDGEMIFTGKFTDFLVNFFGVKGLDPITYEGLVRAHKWLQLGTVTNKQKESRKLRKRRKKLPTAMRKFLKQNPNSRARFYKRLIGTYQDKSNHLIHVALAFKKFIDELKADDFEVVIYPKNSKAVDAHMKYMGANFSVINANALDKQYQRAAMYGLRKGGKLLPGAVSTIVSSPLESIKFDNKTKSVDNSIKVDGFILQQTQKNVGMLEKSLQPFYSDLTNLQVFDADGNPGFKVTVDEDEGTVAYMFGKDVNSLAPKGLSGDRTIKIKDTGEKVEPLRYSDLFGEWNPDASESDGLSLTYLGTQKCLIDATITKKMPMTGIEVSGANICNELGPVQYAIVPKGGKIFVNAEKRLYDLLGINTNSGIRYIDVDTIDFDLEGQTKGLQKESKINFSDIVSLINEYISDE